MAYEKDKPASSTSLRASNPIILANQAAIELALNREHTFSTGGGETEQAQHRQGSARCFFQDSAPTTQVDGGAFVSTDLGSLWFDTNSSPGNQFNVLTATTPTWTPVSDEIIAVLLAANRVFAGTLGVTGNFAVNTDKFTVNASNGNTAVGGTFDIQGTTAVVGVLDEDDLTSDSATNLATQQSIKAYADNSILTAVPLFSRVKALVKFDAGGNIEGTSFNITSVVNDSTGVYTITWDTNFADGNYILSITPEEDNRSVRYTAEAVGSVKVRVRSTSNQNVSQSGCSVIAYGNQ